MLTISSARWKSVHRNTGGIALPGQLASLKLLSKSAHCRLPKIAFNGRSLAAAFLMIVIVSTGCNKVGLFEGAGPIKTVAVNVSVFNEIVLNDKVNLILTYDPVETVRVEAGENLLEDITLAVSDQKLVINDNTKNRWTRDLDYTINVYVNSNRLNRISYYGAGNVTMNNTWKSEHFTIDSYTGIGTISLNLECDSTTVFIRKANADIRIQGRTRYTRVYCADYGTLDLEHFASEEMIMDYRSIRNSTINVTSYLKADILYKGDVYYKGKPQITSLFNSTGKLIALP